MKKSPMVIAIDGVSGSGKSTLARDLARRLKFSYLDTGAMYRALTYKGLQAGADFHDPEGLYRCVRGAKLRLNATGKRIWLDGREVTRQIRSIPVSKTVSLLASAPKIRHWMVRMQRQMAKSRSIVMEGRDIGTVVFPKAQIKFFVIASLEERAKRRQKELLAMGAKTAYKTVLQNLAQRDTLDSARETSPLHQAYDAMVIDSTGMTSRQKTERALELIREKMGHR